MAVLLQVGLEALHDLVVLHDVDPGVQVVGGDDLERDLGHDAEQTNRRLEGVKDIRIAVSGDFDEIPRSVDEPRSFERRREVGLFQTRPVGRGGDGSGYRLCVDVALVGKGQTMLPKRIAEITDGGLWPGLHRELARIDLDYPAERAGVEQDIGFDDRGERVPGADGADRVSAGGRPGHFTLDVGLGIDLHDLPR